MIPSLAQALRIPPFLNAAFIGAGGKTTAIFQLARELNRPVIVTATSHLGVWQIGSADRHIVSDTPAPIEELEHGLNGILLITGALDGERTKPVKNELLNWLQQFCGYHSIPLLIEADGSKEKPLKAWAEHEPPIPAFVDLVIQTAGLMGLGKPLNVDSVHRPEIYSQRSGLRMGELITPGAMVRVLTDIEGGLKNIPVQARKAVLLNQADTDQLQSAAQAIAQSLLPAYDAVVVSSLSQKVIFSVNEPIAGIILAAGDSRRYGQPKQLLDWKGEPFVRAVAKTTLQAGLSPVIVVTGSNAEKVEPTVRDLNVTILRNEEWQSGQASSIKAGVKALTFALTTPGLPLTTVPMLSGSVRQTGGAIFLLADQPQLTGSVIRALVEKHAEGLYPVVAPMVIDRRANPVLFDRVTFPDLLTLEGDVGGRAIFHKHRVEYLPWHDDRLLLDVDTPEMYQRLISDDSL